MDSFILHGLKWLHPCFQRFSPWRSMNRVYALEHQRWHSGQWTESNGTRRTPALVISGAGLGSAPYGVLAWSLSRGKHLFVCQVLRKNKKSMKAPKLSSMSNPREAKPICCSILETKMWESGIQRVVHLAGGVSACFTVGLSAHMARGDARDRSVQMNATHTDRPRQRCGPSGRWAVIQIIVYCIHPSRVHLLMRLGCRIVHCYFSCKLIKIQPWRAIFLVQVDWKIYSAIPFSRPNQNDRKK